MLDQMSECFRIQILVFATCFEKGGYVLKSFHSFDEMDRIVAIHHSGLGFNPLKEIFEDDVR
jgi:hypothetical protein